jgi:hypothetical protein
MTHRALPVAALLALSVAGCHSTRSDQSALTGAWAFTDSKEIYTVTPENGYRQQQDYSRYATTADGKPAAEQLVTVIRPDGTFDLAYSIYGMLGADVMQLRHAGDQCTVYGFDHAPTGTIRVERSEYTLNYSLMRFRVDMQWGYSGEVLLEARRRQDGIVHFRHVMRSEADGEHGVRGLLKPYRGKLPY